MVVAGLAGLAGGEQGFADAVEYFGFVPGNVLLTELG